MKPPYDMRYAVRCMDDKKDVRGIYDQHEGQRFAWIFEIKPNVSKPAPKVTCDQCHGHCKGHRVIHFGVSDFDDLPPLDCQKCNNTGVMDDPNFHWDPQIPPELLNALQKAWREEWNKWANEHFKLTAD